MMCSRLETLVELFGPSIDAHRNISARRMKSNRLSILSIAIQTTPTCFHRSSKVRVETAHRTRARRDRSWNRRFSRLAGQLHFAGCSSETMVNQAITAATKRRAAYPLPLVLPFQLLHVEDYVEAVLLRSRGGGYRYGVIFRLLREECSAAAAHTQSAQQPHHCEQET